MIFCEIRTIYPISQRKRSQHDYISNYSRLFSYTENILSHMIQGVPVVGYAIPEMGNLLFCYPTPVLYYQHTLTSLN